MTCVETGKPYFNSEHDVLAGISGPGHHFSFQGLLFMKNFCAKSASYDGGGVIPLIEFWIHFNVKQANENISESWQEVTANTMGAVRKYLL